MGCGGSKADDLPLVVRCRERRELIRAAANQRYALAAAHVAYFRSLKDVGDALRKFVDEELVLASPSETSSFSSPSLTLPPNSKKKHDNADESVLHFHDVEDEDEESHLHLSDSSSEDEDSEDYKHHHHHDHHGHESDDDAHHHHNHHAHFDKGKGFDDEMPRSNIEESSFQYPRGGFDGYGNGFGGGFPNFPFANPYPFPYQFPPPRPYGEPYMDQWGQPPPVAQPPWNPSSNSNMYFMKKSAPATKTVVQEPPVVPAYGYSDSYWTSPPGYGNVGYGGSANGYGGSANGYGGSANGYGGSAYGYGGNEGYFPMASPMSMANKEGAKVNAPKEPPPPPSPKASAWDFFNPFDVYENGYPGYNSKGEYGYASNDSSPDSSEVREREGIPDLEEETETEVYKEVLKGSRAADSRKKSVESAPRTKAATPARKNMNGNARSVPQHRGENGSRSVPLHQGEGSSRSVPMSKSEDSSKSVPSWSSEEIEKPVIPPQYNRESGKTSMPSQYDGESGKPSTSSPHSKGTSFVDQSPIEDMSGSVSLADDKSSSENIVLKSVDESSVKKKGVTFEMEGTSKQDADSSNLSSVTIMSPHGTRDLQEVVAEIRDEFETASSYGKEVSMLLEVGKLPYQPSILKVIISRILHLVSPSLSMPDPPSAKSAKLASRTMNMAGSYFDDIGKDVNLQACNLSSTLDTLYAWENKLYKEVKDEERLRVIYDKQCRRLTLLVEEGAESSKIDAARASIRKLVTKLDVSIKAIDAISSRINKLRDEELQPQVAALINGLIRMWKAMLKCHRKQFQAIMDSKMRKLRANMSLQGDSRLRATTQLEKELRAWCDRFNDWVTFQKSYVDSLNGWLLQCLDYKPEQTPDGPIPYSPGRLGAPPIFVICNDWKQALEAVSKARVANAMNTFATSLQQLWEKQDEEMHQRLKAEYLSKDYEKHLRARQTDKGKMKLDHDGKSDKTSVSMVPSDSSGISPLDDLKVDLDSMKQKLAEERIKHKDAMKLVHNAASSSLQGGLIPIFKALENFTSEALKAHEHVRIQPTSSNTS